MNLPPIDQSYLVEILDELLSTPSPTGFAHRAIDLVEQKLRTLQVVSHIHRTRKGALVATCPGVAANTPRGLTAHVDTLGAVVKEIKPNGRLKLSRIGGYTWNTVEGEGVTVFASSGEHYRGAVLLTKASSHVHGRQIAEIKRDDANMEVRLDARTTNAEETSALGIEVGDFVTYDPRVEMQNGFIRSRHLDDKAGVACILAAIKALNDSGNTPTQTLTLLFSNYEEVGHGAAAGLPPDLAELVAVDMAALGEGQNSDEFHATLCVKDSGGPYHHGLSQQLRALARKHQIAYKVDIYPYYGSDGEAYWRAGGDVAVALIGPGVDASHNYERTHLDALLSTAAWVIAYILS